MKKMNKFDISDVCHLRQTVVVMDCSNEGSTDPDCDCDGCDGS